jgi:hypothetical protein
MKVSLMPLLQSAAKPVRHQSRQWVGWFVMSSHFEMPQKRWLYT